MVGWPEGSRVMSYLDVETKKGCPIPRCLLELRSHDTTIRIIVVEGFLGQWLQLPSNRCHANHHCPDCSRIGSVLAALAAHKHRSPWSHRASCIHNAVGGARISQRVAAYIRATGARNEGSIGLHKISVGSSRNDHHVE